MNDRELFLYELDGHGYTFENMTWLGNCFEDNFLNMAWEMWCASANREGYRLVPLKPNKEMISAGSKCWGGAGIVSIYTTMINSI